MAEVSKSKKEMIEKTTKEFKKLNNDNQMFILGYMLGIQQERQKTQSQDRKSTRLNSSHMPKSRMPSSA